MFNNQGNSKPEASHSENGDMASEWEELVELDDVQLATVVGGWGGWNGRVASQPSFAEQQQQLMLSLWYQRQLRDIWAGPRPVRAVPSIIVR
jgi:hypothetical protein